MAPNTGRTVAKYVDFRIGDSGGVLRSIPVDSINGVGLTYDESDVTAFQDAIKNALLGLPTCKITITGAFDTSAAVAVSGSGVAPALSGSHTVLSALAGSNTPRSLDVQVGIGHPWETGEPQFGISSSAASGFVVSGYTFDPGTGKYTATLAVKGGVAPAWGTAAET